MQLAILELAEMMCRIQMRVGQFPKHEPLSIAKRDLGNGEAGVSSHAALPLQCVCTMYVVVAC